MRILVTGATGNVGRLVVDHLLARGAQVRALTTNPRKAALPPEVEIARGYLGRPDTLPAGLADVDRMYLAPLPATAARVAHWRSRQACGDIAEVAAVCLREDGHRGCKYPLIGGAAISRAQMARCIRAALGREVPFVEQARAQARAELLPAMGDAVDWYLDGLADAAVHPHTPGTTVADVCGRPATTYAQWAFAHADEFRPVG